MFGKLQLYALIGLAFMAGLFGIYWKGAQSARFRLEAKQNAARIEAMRQKNRIEDDVENDDDDDLLGGITRKLR
jgi:uncharacterized membrane protein